MVQLQLRTCILPAPAWLQHRLEGGLFEHGDRCSACTRSARRTQWVQEGETLQ